MRCDRRMGSGRVSDPIEYDGLNMMLGFKIDWILGEKYELIAKER